MQKNFNTILLLISKLLSEKKREQFSVFYQFVICQCLEDCFLDCFLFARPCYVMFCYVTLRYVKLCYVMLCYVMLCYVMLCYVVLCYVRLYILTSAEPAKNSVRPYIKSIDAWNSKIVFFVKK